MKFQIYIIIVKYNKYISPRDYYDPFGYKHCSGSVLYRERRIIMSKKNPEEKMKTIIHKYEKQYLSCSKKNRMKFWEEFRKAVCRSADKKFIATCNKYFNVNHPNDLDVYHAYYHALSMKAKVALFKGVFEAKSNDSVGKNLYKALMLDIDDTTDTTYEEELRLNGIDPSTMLRASNPHGKTTAEKKAANANTTIVKKQAEKYVPIVITSILNALENMYKEYSSGKVYCMPIEKRAYRKHTGSELIHYITKYRIQKSNSIKSKLMDLISEEYKQKFDVMLEQYIAARNKYEAVHGAHV